jgi:PAS domain S-box-containing protein
MGTIAKTGPILSHLNSLTSTLLSSDAAFRQIMPMPVWLITGSLLAAIVLLLFFLRSLSKQRLLAAKLVECESQYRAILTAMPDLIMRFRQDGTCLDFIPTKQFSALLSAEEAIGQHISEKLPAEVAELQMHYIQTALATGELQVFEYQLIVAQQVHIYEARAVVSGVDEVLMIVRDITTRKQSEAERRQTEKALRQSQEKFSKAFLSSPIPITITALSDGRHLEVNESFCQITGFSKAEVIGRTSLELSLWVDVGERQRIFQILQAEGAVQNYEFRYRTKHGAIRTALLSLETIDLNGQECLLSLSSDITERKQAEEALSQKNEALIFALQQLKATQQELIQSEKMAALGQLVAGVAHEINTPLGAIRSSIENIAEFMNGEFQKLPEFLNQLSPERYADFFALLHCSSQQTDTFSSKEKRQFKRQLIRQLEEENIPQADSVADALIDMNLFKDIEPFLALLKDHQSERILKNAYQLASIRKSVSIITMATDRAAKIVFALRTYAHQNSSGEKVLANVLDGLETVLTLYQNQLKQGVEVIRNYSDLPTIWCYPDELNQVWTNLIHNALQAMDYKGTLTITVVYANQQAIIKIADSGQGISPEIMSRIFEPFFSTKPSGEGSGLGLDIVRRIVEKHEGQIQVESVPGETVFTVLLPTTNHQG